MDRSAGSHMHVRQLSKHALGLNQVNVCRNQHQSQPWCESFRKKHVIVGRPSRTSYVQNVHLSLTFVVAAIPGLAEPPHPQLALSAPLQQALAGHFKFLPELVRCGGFGM